MVALISVSVNGLVSLATGSLMRLDPTEAIEIFVGPINGPKRFGFNELASDFTGQIEDTKKPANLNGVRAFRTSPDLSGNTRIIIWWAGYPATGLRR